MNRNHQLALVALAALALGACSSGPGPVYPDRLHVPIGGESIPVLDDTVEPGQAHLYSIENFQGIGDFDLLVIELDSDLTLEQTDRSGQAVHAVSTGPVGFGPPPASPDAESLGAHDQGAIGPAGIAVAAPNCRGSCLVFEAQNDVLYFQVRGADVPTDYSLYAYFASYSDGTEPSNDYTDTAARYVLRSSDGGAIETLGDVDWWQVAADGPDGPLSGTITFHAPNASLDLRLHVYDNGVVRDEYYTDGDTLEVYRYSVMRVRSGNGSAARGPNGFYYFEPELLFGPAAEG